MGWNRLAELILYAIAGEWLQGDRNQSLWRDLAFGKAVHRNRISRLLTTVSFRRRQRIEAGIQMLAIKAERQAGVEGLRRRKTGPLIREVADLASGAIKDPDGLLVVRLRRAEACVDDRNIPPIG